MKRFLVLTLPAFVVSCERTAVREYEAPKETFPQKAAVREQIEQAQNSAQAPAISLKAPPHWQPQPPAPMRKASFFVQEADGAKVDISVTSFQGESGGLLANINRWRGQLGLDAVDAEQLESTIERRTLAGREFLIVDFANEQAPADKKQRVIGAIVPAPGETWFFKMTGDDALTAAQKPAFFEVLESAEFPQRMNLPLLRVLSSLRLTVVLLALSMMLVFMATLAQTRLGIWEVMSRYIRTFVVWVPVGGRELPVFPGGWLLGGLLLVNLIAAHASRFKWSWKKAPLLTIHGGLVVLLLSELITGLFARETEITLDEGAVRSYSEAPRHAELVIVDSSSPERDRVWAIAQKWLGSGGSHRAQYAALSGKGSSVLSEFAGIFANFVC